MCSPGMRQKRHPHLENFLMQKFGHDDCCSPVSFSTSVNYEPCVVSGVDPSHGIGPVPYFVYLVPTKERLLAVHWPAKNVETLVLLKNVIDIIAVAGVSPIFLFSPYKEKAQQIRIHYHDELHPTALEDAPKAIDVYLLDPPITFLKYLRRLWIQRLINGTLAPNDAILVASNIGSCNYEWLIQSISRSTELADPKRDLANISRISIWSKHDPGFRKSWWEDATVFSWIFDRLQGFQYISLCVEILYSVLWLPLTHNHMKSPTQVMVQTLTNTSNWKTCLKQVLDFSFALIKLEHRHFWPEETVFLFKTFVVFDHLIDRKNGTSMLQFIRFYYCEEFRYYVIEDQLSGKFTEFCKLKNLIISLGRKLKRAVLCDTKKYSSFH